MATTRMTWCRSQIEQDWSAEFWMAMQQYPSNWNRQQDIVTYLVPHQDCTWLALQWPEWQGGHSEQVDQ